jgi:hypothetical protein
MRPACHPASVHAAAVSHRTRRRAATSPPSAQPRGRPDHGEPPPPPHTPLSQRQEGTHRRPPRHRQTRRWRSVKIGFHWCFF